MVAGHVAPGLRMNEMCWRNNIIRVDLMNFTESVGTIARGSTGVLRKEKEILEISPLGEYVGTTLMFFLIGDRATS